MKLAKFEISHKSDAFIITFRQRLASKGFPGIKADVATVPLPPALDLPMWNKLGCPQVMQIPFRDVLYSQRHRARSKTTIRIDGESGSNGRFHRAKLKEVIITHEF